MKTELTSAKLWLIRALFLGLLFLTALIDATVIIPTLIVGLSFAGAIIFSVAGVFTKRYGAAKLCGWIFLLSLVATVVGGVTSLSLQMGEAKNAHRLVTAIEQYHKEQGAYPPSLDALVPTQLPALPSPKWGQTSTPYFYRPQSNAFTLSYSVGFKVHQVYDSKTRTWTTED